MDHSGMNMGNTTNMATPKIRYTAMTFYWGKNSEILFTGWPGTRGGMYALALIVVFVLAVLIEMLSNCRLTKPGANRIAAGLTQTAVHAIRVGLAYVMMLAVMSFNGGVLIVAVFGHAVGFLAFRSLASGKNKCEGPNKGDLPEMPCC
ncbi:copper transporter 1-like [Typha angustifolia]|uniref:copper transporter 1-like n=1 Tax=Typha angustifolia TaxID=59011 RepID=UPI003C2F00DE